jgi:hypothetical protein
VAANRKVRPRRIGAGPWPWPCGATTVRHSGASWCAAATIERPTDPRAAHLRFHNHDPGTIGRLPSRQLPRSFLGASSELPRSFLGEAGGSGLGRYPTAIQLRLSPPRRISHSRSGGWRCRGAGERLDGSSGPQSLPIDFEGRDARRICAARRSELLAVKLALALGSLFGFPPPPTAATTSLASLTPSAWASRFCRLLSASSSLVSRLWGRGTRYPNEPAGSAKRGGPYPPLPPRRSYHALSLSLTLSLSLSRSPSSVYPDPYSRSARPTLSALASLLSTPTPLALVLPSIPFSLPRPLSLSQLFLILYPYTLRFSPLAHTNLKIRTGARTVVRTAAHTEPRTRSRAQGVARPAES